MDFTGKRVLVTGGSRGIGRAADRLFAMAGSDVAFTYASRKEWATKVKGPCWA